MNINKTFIVRTGNWKVRVVISNDTKKVSDMDYIEATTQAIESCFGESELENCELLELFDEEGKNYFSPRYKGDLSEVPEFLFGVLIVCYLQVDAHTKTKWRYYVSSEIFANASQSENYKLAVDFEKKWKNHIDTVMTNQNRVKEIIKTKRSELKKVEKKIKK